MIDGNLAMNSHFENMSEKDMQEGIEWYEKELKKDIAIGFAEWIRYNDWESKGGHLKKYLRLTIAAMKN